MGNLDTQLKDWGSMFGSPVTTDGELAHFGVLGMKWGVRKDRDKGSGGGIKGFLKKRKNIRKMKKLRKLKKMKAKLEVKRMKKEAKLSAKREKLLNEMMKDPNVMYKNRHKFSLDELKKANERFEAEKNLNKYRMTYLNRGNEYMNMLINYGETIYKGYGLYKKFFGGNAVEKAGAVSDALKIAKEQTKQAKAHERAIKANEKATKATVKANEKEEKARAKAMKNAEKVAKANTQSTTQNEPPKGKGIKGQPWGVNNNNTQQRRITGPTIERVSGEVVDNPNRYSMTNTTQPRPRREIIYDVTWRESPVSRQYSLHGSTYIANKIGVNTTTLLLEDKKKK